MQNNQIVRFLLTALVTFFVIFILLVVLLPQATFKSPNYLGFFEISLSWILRFTGLSLIIFSIISLILAGSALTEAKNLAKWIALIMLGLLLINPTWSLAFGIAIILVALVIIEYLGDHGKSSDAHTD